MEEAEKSSFVEIKPSGFPKMREKKKFEKGGTGVENGWGREMAHSTGPLKKRIFFCPAFKIFLVFFCSKQALKNHGAKKRSPRENFVLFHMSQISFDFFHFLVVFIINMKKQKNSVVLLLKLQDCSLFVSHNSHECINMGNKGEQS